MNQTTLQVVRTFAEAFTTEFYDLGYADAVRSCGVCSAEDHESMSRALAYMKGYADACCIACPARSRQWVVANAVASMFGIIQCMIDAGDSSEMIARSLTAYRKDLAILVDRS